MRSMYWMLVASIKGISYEEYLDQKLDASKKELEELPDTNNFLSFLLEYYSFKSGKLTCEMLIMILGVSLTLFVISVYFEFTFVQLALPYWGTQAAMFSLGFYLKRKYR